MFFFVNLQKAYDTAEHDIFLSKPEHYGLRCLVMNGLSLIPQTESNMFMILIIILLRKSLVFLKDQLIYKKYFSFDFGWYSIPLYIVH